MSLLRQQNEDYKVEAGGAFGWQLIHSKQDVNFNSHEFETHLRSQRAKRHPGEVQGSIRILA
jgi:hypothetical protein